jgi:hypothetical protein
MRQPIKLGNLPKGVTGVDQRTRLALTTMGHPTSARAGVTTGAVIGATHVYPGLFTGVSMTSTSATGVIERLAACYEAKTQEVQKRCAEGDWNALLAFLQEHPQELDQQWVRDLMGDAVTSALKTRNRAFIKELQGLWKSWNPHGWDASVRVFGRVGTFIYQGAESLYWIWGQSTTVWGRGQGRETRRRLFGLAPPHVVANLLWLSSQWVKHQRSTSDAEIKHVGYMNAETADCKGLSIGDKVMPPESGGVVARSGRASHQRTGR